MRIGRRVPIATALLLVVISLAWYFYPRASAELPGERNEAALGSHSRLQKLRDYNDGKQVNVQEVRRIVERFVRKKAKYAEQELLRSAQAPDEEVAYLSLRALHGIGSRRLIPVAIAVIKSQSSELVKTAAGEILKETTGQAFEPDDYEAWTRWYDTGNNENVP